MESELAGINNGISGSFVPERDLGRLIEVEQVSRYHWAAQLAKDRKVLDAGCGTGYGSRLLAAGGAREVVGIDIARAVLEAMAPDTSQSVRLQVGDVRKLDFDDDTFELVVCFEVVEHVDDPSAVLDELVRVLVPGGLLIVSAPNCSVHQPGNPHHLNEFLSAELGEELAARLDHVRLLRQHDYVASAVLSDATSKRADGAAIRGLALHKLIANARGEEIYTIALASDSALPEIHELGAMTGTHELRDWLSAFDTQSRALAEKDNEIEELRSRLGERDRLAELVRDAELRLAEVPELNLRITDLEFELAQAREVAAAARREAHQLDQALMYGRRMLRYVRPLVKQVRRVRGKLRG